MGNPSPVRINKTGRLAGLLPGNIRLADCDLPTFATDVEARESGLLSGDIYKRPDGRFWAVAPLESEIAEEETLQVE
jgi:hypothetical protein